MTQASPEGNFNFRGDTLLSAPPVPRDEPLLFKSFVSTISQDPYVSFEENNFKDKLIGPKDASDTSRNYLVNRIERISEVVVGAVVKNPSLGLNLISKDYPRLKSEVTNAINDGTLRLGADYPRMNSAAQIDSFIGDTFGARMPHAQTAYDSYASVRANNELHPQVYAPETEVDVEKLQEKLDSAEMRIIEGHHLLVEIGASDEVIAQYDIVAGLATGPELDAHAEGTNTGKFWQIVGNRTLSIFGLKLARSSEVRIIREDAEIIA